MKMDLTKFMPRSSKIVKKNNTVVDYGDYLTQSLGITKGAFGGNLTIRRKPELSSVFSSGIDTTEFNTTKSANADVLIENSMLKLESGDAISIARIETKRFLRYRAGRDAEVMFTYRFGQALEMSNHLIGLFDDNDGFAIGWIDGQIGVLRRRAEIDYFVSQEDFNKDKLDGEGDSGMLINWSKINVFRIHYGYLGVAPIKFQVQYNDVWITFHEVRLENTVEETSIASPYLPFRAEILNYGNTQPIYGLSGSLYFGIIDGGETAENDSSARGYTGSRIISGFTAGTNKTAIVFNNKELFNGKQNKISALLLFISAYVDATKGVSFQLVKLKQAPTGGIWTDLDSDNSVMRISFDAVPNTSNVESLIPFNVGKTDDFFQKLSEYGLLLYPGEYACILYTSTGQGDLAISNRWLELF